MFRNLPALKAFRIATLLTVVAAGFETKAQISTLASASAVQNNTIPSFTVPAGTNRVLVVTASDASSIDIAGVTFNGSALVQQAERNDGFQVDAFFTISLGSSSVPTTGAITFSSITSLPGNTGRYLTATVFQNVNQTTPFTGVISYDGFSSTHTHSVSSANGDLVFDLFDSFNFSTATANTPGAGQTTIFSSGTVNFGSGNGSGYYSVSTKPGNGGTVSSSWTTSNNTIIHITANLQLQNPPVPVTLISFNATAKGAASVLDWTIANPVRFSHFEVERSLNGIEFAMLEKVKPDAARNYSYTDANAPAEAYYRLKMVDADGTYKYSNVLRVQHVSSTNFEMTSYPNPATELLTVKISNGAANGKAMLLNAAGQVVDVQVLQDGKAGFDLQVLPAGFYLLEYRDGVNTATQKVQKL